MTSGPAHERYEILLSLDIGISTVKASLFDPQGALLSFESQEYLILPEGDKVEVAPETYWDPLVQAIRILLSKWTGDPARIVAVSVSSHTETVISLDGTGCPVRPALVWMDSRSQPQADELSRTIGLARVREISGQADINPIWPVTKFRWLAENEAQNFARTYKFLLPEDYILYRLSGELVAEQTVWSSSLVLDIRTKRWCDELVEFGGLQRNQLPRMCAPGEVIGFVSEACARETGLLTTTRVVAGAIDQICAALGAGNINEGVVTESTGSVLALLATVSQPVMDADCPVPCHIHALPDMYCLLPWNPCGGLLLKWFKDTFTPAPSGKERSIYDELTAEAGEVNPGSDGLLILPHFEGALFPEYNPSARGVFFGVKLAHGRGHIVRAIMESVAYLIRRDLDGMRRLGVKVHEIRTLGGGAKSHMWSQIKANVCQTRVVVPSQTESASLGAAMLAAVGAGLYRSIPEAVSKMTGDWQAFEPDSTLQFVYDRCFSLYADLYDQVKPLFPACENIALAARGSAVKPVMS